MLCNKIMYQCRPAVTLINLCYELSTINCNWHGCILLVTVIVYGKNIGQMYCNLIVISMNKEEGTKWKGCDGRKKFHGMGEKGKEREEMGREEKREERRGKDTGKRRDGRKGAEEEREREKRKGRKRRHKRGENEWKGKGGQGNGGEARCDRTYDTYVIFSDNVRTIRVRHFVRTLTSFLWT